MAENLLHTHSGYAHAHINTNFINRLVKKHNSSIDIMERKEEQLYKLFGATDFNGFRKQLLTLFNKNDLKVIHRFEAESLSKSLAIFSSQHEDLYGEEVELKFNFTKLRKLQSINQMLGIDIPKGKGVSIRTKYTVSEIKKIINEIFGRHFHTTSTFTKEIDAFVHQLLTSGVLQIGIGREGRTEEKDFSKKYIIHEIPNFPWGVTKKVYTLSVKTGNKAILDEINKATQRIYLFLQNDLAPDGSVYIKNAIRNVWKKLCKDGNDPALFFSGGTETNFISGVQGALGEFQAALIFEYVHLKTGLLTFPSIKGSTRLEETLTKEEARTDVEIFEAIGLQVKNFNVIQSNMDTKQKSFIHNITTKIHPNKLAEYFDEDIRYDFLNFMANVFFNEDYYQDERIKLTGLMFVLRDWIGEIMNMALNDSIKDTVTFYLISGRYLVPCSVILRVAEQIGLNNSISIHSSFQRYTNEEFNEQDGDGPRYATYWERKTGGVMDELSYWESTPRNQTTFNNLVGHHISIRTNFNYFEEIEKQCALW